MADTPRTIGPYEIIGELGRGGMGVVYRARQPGLDREVAIKVLLGGAHSDDAARERFLREAKATAQLRHPHIVAVYDTGFEGDLPYIAMDFIPGQSLDDAIAAEALTVTRATEIARQIADALHHAHEAGLVHRDVKPANVLLDENGTAYLTDFGLARQVEDASGLTASGAILGTPSYMAPEQARAEGDVDARADVYGLGAMLYEMVVGRPPFEGDTPIQTLTRVLHDDPTPPRRLAPRVSHQLELVCLTAIAKERERRYQSAAAMAEDCRRVLAGEPIAARAPGLEYRVRRAVRRHRVLASTLVLAAAGTAAGVYLLAVRPAQQARAADVALLDGALGARRGLLAQFGTAVETGKHDEAIRIGTDAHGTTPPLPKVRDATLADLPPYAELALPLQLDLAAAYLARGRARMKAGDVLGRHDLVAAFRLGRTGPLGRTAARDGLLDLALYFEQHGAHREAERTARLCTATFGTEVPAARALMARMRARSGHIEEAAQWWHSLRDDATFGATAKQQLEIAAALSPAALRPTLSGRFVSADFDGDGTHEVVHVNRDWWLRIREPMPPWTGRGNGFELPDRVQKADAGLLKVLDIDGDGRPELIVSGGSWQRGGRLLVLGWRDGAMKVLGSAPLATHANDVTLADLDHDGTNELVVAVDWHERGLRMFRFTESAGLTELYRWRLLCDPYLVHGLPDGRLLIGLGPWLLEAPPLMWVAGRTGVFADPNEPQDVSRPWGYRLVVLGDGGTGQYREVAATKVRMGRGRVCFLGPEEFVVAAGCALDVRKVLPDRVLGLFRYRVTATGLSEPERLDARWGDSDLPEVPVTWRLPSGWHVAVPADDALFLAPVDGGAGIRIDSKHIQRVVPVQADDDPELELAVTRRKGGELWMYGRGAFVPGPLPRVRAHTAGTSGAPVPPEQELLEAGLYDEVIVACRERMAAAPDPDTAFRLGSALAARSRWAEAAAAFGTAAEDRTRAVDALMRRAHALEETRDWPALATCLQTLSDTPGADPLAMEFARGKLPSVREASTLISRLEWTAGTAPEPFFCTNPMKTRIAPEGVASWSTSEFRGESHGQFFRYEGGPVRVTFRLRTGAVQWATDFRVGIAHADTLTKTGWSVGGPTLEFVASASGASDDPTIRAELRAVGASDRRQRHRLRDDVWIPATDTDYDVRLEYLPGLGRAWCDVIDVASGDVILHLQVRSPARWERGDYFVGRSAEKRDLHESGEQVTRSEIRAVRLDGTPALTARTPDTPGLHVLLGLANGRLAQGDLEGAAGRYRRISDAPLSAATPDTRARYHLFRALAVYRLTRTALAREQLVLAVDADPKLVARMLAAHAPATLTDTERVWFRREAAAAAAGK